LPILNTQIKTIKKINMSFFFIFLEFYVFLDFYVETLPKNSYEKFIIKKIKHIVKIRHAHTNFTKKMSTHNKIHNLKTISTKIII